MNNARNCFKKIKNKHQKVDSNNSITRAAKARTHEKPTEANKEFKQIRDNV